MSYKMSLETFPVAGVSKLLATNYGAHIFDVTASTDLWNGALITKGSMISFDNYEEGEATDINAEIVWEAANGNFYVEVLEDTDTLFVYNVPYTELDYTTESESEKYFYIAEGEVARAHQLKAGDIFELSEDGFDGTPEVGATITSISDKKPVVTSSSDSDTDTETEE